MVIIFPICNKVQGALYLAQGHPICNANAPVVLHLNQIQFLPKYKCVEGPVSFNRYLLHFFPVSSERRWKLDMSLSILLIKLTRRGALISINVCSSILCFIKINHWNLITFASKWSKDEHMTDLLLAYKVKWRSAEEDNTPGIKNTNLQKDKTFARLPTGKQRQDLEL